MIKFIELNNFQSHAKSKLEFVPGVNVIVGSSDAGKTAIIRALRKMVWNRPSGDAMCSSWGGNTSLHLVAEDGTVDWYKDKTDRYVLSIGGERTEFKAFGTTVPEEIIRFLNLNEGNLQSQLDAPYLLSLTPGDVAAHWNNIAKLSAIDKGTTNVNSAIRELTSDIKYKTEQETRLTEEIATYPDMEIYEYDVSALEDMEKEKAVLANSANKLHATTSAYRLVVANLKEKSEILVYEKPVLELLELHKERNLLANEQKRLSVALSNLSSIQDRIKVQGQQIALEVPLMALLKLHEDKKVAETTFLVFSTAVSNIKSIQERIIKGNAYIKSQDEIFKTDMGSQCILCGSQLKHEH